MNIGIGISSRKSKMIELNRKKWKYKGDFVETDNHRRRYHKINEGQTGSINPQLKALNTAWVIIVIYY
ncbi:hypothetical protein BpHYR1_003066 [Brachionus plicatilis]|uniref:Uncharacterized protein n=1 Tax=Brachionus plicatilis TaxID=10195 RepID=A0A3M7SF56_BRAPC|nr:hypothetical protein BpHYR1_003066 [Brachionus plicatilis]